MFQYFVKFGDKPCCITDLKIFLDLIVRDQQVQVISISNNPRTVSEVAFDYCALWTSVLLSEMINRCKMLFVCSYLRSHRADSEQLTSPVGFSSNRSMYGSVH